MDKNDLEVLSGFAPDYVVERADEKGYFSLGAIPRDDEDEGIL